MFWMVSRELEMIYGRFEIVALYISSGIFSSVIFILYMWSAGDPQVVGLGASGVVTAMLVLFAFHFPRRIFLFWGVIPVQAKYLVIGYILFDVLGLSRNSNIGHAAHLGGAAFAYLYWMYNIRFSSLLKRL